MTMYEYLKQFSATSPTILDAGMKRWVKEHPDYLVKRVTTHQLGVNYFEGCVMFYSENPLPDTKEMEFVIVE